MKTIQTSKIVRTRYFDSVTNNLPLFLWVERITTKFQGMGFIETILFAIKTGGKILYSRVYTFILNLRGYDISQSVQFGKNILFFQDTQHAIKIGENAMIGSGVRMKAILKGKIRIGAEVSIDDGTNIHSVYKVTVGKGTLIAAGVYILDSNHALPIRKSRYLTTKQEGYTGAAVKIGEYVWIGTNTVILQGVTIGDNAIIGAGAIVTKDIPANTVAVGNPARVIKTQR